MAFYNDNKSYSSPLYNLGGGEFVDLVLKGPLITYGEVGEAGYVLTAQGGNIAPKWVAASGGGATDLTFTGGSSPYTLNSSTGTDVTFAAGTGITLSRSSNELTITASGTGGNGIYGGSGTVPTTTEVTLTDYLDVDNGLFFLDGTNLRVGMGTPQPDVRLEVRSNGLGVTQNVTEGILISNTTNATAGLQQMSPAIRWRGFGWKTNATAGSQAVDFMADVLPVQGAVSPTGSWQLKSSINGGAYTTAFAVSDLGNITLGANITISPGNGTTTFAGATGRNYDFGGSVSALTAQTFVGITKQFAPTSGTGVYNSLGITTTINQTGGANGITRGLYINPTLISAADFRALEISNNSGYGIYQSGASATNYFAGNTGVGTATTTYRLSLPSSASNLDGIGFGTDLNLWRVSASTLRVGSGAAGLGGVDAGYFQSTANAGIFMNVASVGTVLKGTGGANNVAVKIQAGTELQTASGVGALVMTSGTFNPNSGTAEGYGLVVANQFATTSTYSGPLTAVRISPQLFSTTGATSIRLLDVGTNTAYENTGTHTSMFTILSSGNVGIGTSAPRTALDINVPATSSILGSNIQLMVGGGNGSINHLYQIGLGKSGVTYPSSIIGAENMTGSGNGYSEIFFATRSATTDTVPIERMRITGAGLVGIGTTSPDRLLHAEVSDAVTNAITYTSRESHITSGVATTGFGVGKEWELENASGTNRVAATQEFTWSDAVNATEDATYTLKLMRAGTLTEAFNVSSTGTLGINVINNVSLLQMQSGGIIAFGPSTRSRITSPADGQILFTNAAGTDFNRLQFGGTTSSFPSIKRNATAIDIRLADDSGFAPLNAATTTVNGGLTATGQVIVGANLQGASGSRFYWTSRSAMSSPSDGVIRISNNAATDFDRLQFGGTTSSFPALKRSTTTLQARLADDSADASMTMASLTLSGILVGPVQALSGSGAVNITQLSTAYTSTGIADALTLADGAVGQIKTICHVVDGGAGTLTPDKTIGYTTITFNNVGDSVTLQFFTQGWAIIGIRGAVAA